MRFPIESPLSLTHTLSLSLSYLPPLSRARSLSHTIDRQESQSKLYSRGWRLESTEMDSMGRPSTLWKEQFISPLNRGPKSRGHGRCARYKDVLLADVSTRLLETHCVGQAVEDFANEEEFSPHESPQTVCGTPGDRGRARSVCEMRQSEVRACVREREREGGG